MIIEPLYCLFARKNYDRSPIVGFVSSDECVRSSSFEKNEKEMIKRRKKHISWMLLCPCLLATTSMEHELVPTDVRL